MSLSDCQASLVRVPQALSFLNVSRTKLYTLMREGQLPFVKLGKVRRITWEALISLVARNTSAGAAQFCNGSGRAETLPSGEAENVGDDLSRQPCSRHKPTAQAVVMQNEIKH